MLYSVLRSQSCALCSLYEFQIKTELGHMSRAVPRVFDISHDITEVSGLLLQCFIRLKRIVCIYRGAGIQSK